MRVLVVEDERDVGDVLVEALAELGHQPSLVRSAEAALGRLDLERPDTILLDVNLPGMSGLDFLRLPLVRDSGIPVVAVSGVATEAQARECLRLGALDFVGKPVPLDRLRDMLVLLEPIAINRRFATSRAQPERRRAPRVQVAIPAAVGEYGRPSWQGTLTSLSVSGAKVRSASRVTPGLAAKLAFTPPDGGPAVELMAVLIRTDTDGYAYHFVHLTPEQNERLGRVAGRQKAR